jgi:hypothetical protein
MSTERPPFPEIINSSLIADFRSCQQKAFLSDFMHWKSRSPSVHLIAGAAFARGLEVTRKAFYEEGMDPESAVAMGLKALITAYGDFECPPDSAKSCERMAGALEYYFSRYPLGEDAAEVITVEGKHAIEFNFSEPLDIAHPVTRQPLIYTGRFDAIVRYSGLTLGCDEKTTSQLGASWPRQWDLRSQFTAYTWGAGKAGIKLDGFLVRGVSILKTKYDTAEAITYRPQWQVERWYTQLLRDLYVMIEAWESGVWDYNLDHACAEYGGCPFRSVCLLRDPAELLQQQYERRRWDPVTRTETLIEEAA